MRAPSFYSDPHVQFLSQLLEEIGAGYLQVPRFQRPFIWNWERRRELLRSIRDGIPMGSVMVWRTAKTTVECYNYLGPYPLAEPEFGSTRSYILDGVQRLSTLYGALHVPTQSWQTGSSELDDDDDIDGPDQEIAQGGLEVFVDLKTMDFCIPELDDVAGMMPLSIVYSSVALLQFQRRLTSYGDDRMIAASDEIARAFRDYKVPIIPITTDDVEMATRTFQRINSQGAKMSEAHMVHALTWSPNFDLRRQITDLSAEFLSEIGWGGIDDDPVLKAVKASFGLDVYKTNAQDLSDELKLQPSAVREVIAAISRAASFLKYSCGIPSPDFVPYALQIVVLAEAFRTQPSPTEYDKRNLVAWFWMTTYGELFAGMSGDRVQLALQDMRRMLQLGQPIWTWKRPYEERPLAKAFDFRAARAKALVVRLAEQQDRVYGDSFGFRVLSDSGKRAAVQIVPWVMTNKATYSSPANRFLLHPGEASVLRERLLSGELTQQDRAAHLVSDQAQAAILRGDFEAFVDTRLHDIQQLEAAFITPLAGMFLSPQSIHRDLFV
ncbi:DUF262 domain-containing protein [Devosia sp. FKR38]|uniref:DUF262 domain-containing protein n=1 Tax=Devosia sp. FKR38 TaxID=2562312 RepID=UPI0010BFB54F|nr:DUF262 domain-containing protein [Devosia sp. FKR38]